MRILSIGTDRKLFDEMSAVRARQHAYAEKLGAMDIIVFSKGASLDAVHDGLLTIIPTRSSSRLSYGFDAMRIARTTPVPDVVTAQDPFETGLAAYFIARRLGVPLHVQVHTDFLAPGYVRGSFLNRIRRRIAWFVLKRAARVRVTLERTRDQLRHAGITAPITVLPIFIDAARYASIPRAKHPRWKIALLCVGRLEKEKEYMLALESLMLLRRKGHDAGLTIVGDGSMRAALESRARRLRIHDRVEFVGWQADLARYYSEADILLVTSRYEGYGLVIVEALAAGIPVLSTDVGVAREAGAIVVGARGFGAALLRWIENGPRKGTLALAPYTDQASYVERYCSDIAGAIKRVV